MVDPSHRRRFGVLAEPIVWENPVAELKMVVDVASKFSPPAKALLADASDSPWRWGRYRDKADFPDAQRS